MANLNALAVSTLWTGASGALFGSLIDAIMPGELSCNRGNALMQAFTVFGQLLANALFVYASNDFARQRSLLSGDDAVDNVMNSIALLVTQPRLAQRIMSLVNYVRSVLTDSVMGGSSSAGVPASTIAGTDSGHKDATSPETIQMPNAQSVDYQDYDE